MSDIEAHLANTSTGSDLVIDGRTARRQRNKDAVLDSLIELSNELDGEPTIEAIAERAGVSYRSVYRYFDDRTDLMLSAITRVMGELWPIFEIDHMGEGSLDERISGLVDARLAAYRKLAPLTRIAVRLRANDPAVAEGYDRVREYLRAQLVSQFQPEFSAMPARERGAVLAALDSAFQFESLDYLANHHEMTDKVLAQVLTREVNANLAYSEHSLNASR